jgi:hypothetical protein
MGDKEILNYVQKSLGEGYTTEQVTTALSRQGWGSVEINTALLEAQKIRQQKPTAPKAPSAPFKKSKQKMELKNLSASQILLYLGGLIVILAGIIYIGTNWSQWEPAPRILAIFLPMLICYGVGKSMWSSKQYKKQGIVFLVVGSMLFPFFLSVMFKELEIFTRPFNNSFNLTLSSLTLVLYLVCSFIFRYPIWALLYQGAGLFVYIFFLRFIGVESTFVETTMAWLLLIPGTGYLFLSLFYDKNKQEREGIYSHAIGSLVIVSSFLRLFVETFSHDTKNLSWVLAVFGVIYFLLGIFYEKNNFKKYCQAPYLIGTGIVFFSLWQLATDGTLLKYFTENTNASYDDIVSWSMALVGVVYLALAFVIEGLKNLQLEKAAAYKEFFNYTGPFWILAAVYSLGLEGKKPVYETLLLLLSLGFIFGSIPKLARQYLFIGTLFLIVYIFSIGGEYFQNEVGWPITLFVAGLASMGVSIGIEKVRRKYFAKDGIQRAEQ